MQHNKCSLARRQDDLIGKIFIHCADCNFSTAMSARHHHRLTTDLRAQVFRIDKSIEIEDRCVVGRTILVPGLPLGAPGGEHRHTVQTAPALAQNGGSQLPELLAPF